MQIVTTLFLLDDAIIAPIRNLYEACGIGCVNVTSIVW
jgi:hypothetical protein